MFLTLISLQLDARQKDNPFQGDNPWPEIRKERINVVLPQAMKAAGVDVWVVVCRENNNDPIAHHVGGENAGGTAVFLFQLEEGLQFSYFSWRKIILNRLFFHRLVKLLL